MNVMIYCEPELKEHIINLHIQDGRTYQSLSEEFGFSPDVIRRKKMNKGRFIGFYQLNRDKEPLQYIYNQRDVLRYVIFTDGQYFEVIAIKDTPELIKSIGKDVAFEGSIEKKRRIDIFVIFRCRSN